MARRFCTACGSALDEGQRFCTSCGQQVQDYAAAASPVTQAADTSGLDRMVNDPGFAQPAAGYQASSASAQGTKVMPAVRQATPASVAPAAPGAAAGAAPQGGRKSNAGLVAAIVVAVAIVAIAVIVAILQPWNSSGSGQESASSASTATAPISGSSSAATVVASSSSSAKAPSASTSSSSSADDEKIKSALVSAYDKMADYNTRIADCATTFNNTYTSTDASVRAANQSVAQSLREEISADLDTLKNLSGASSSRYAQSYSDILRLQQDLFNRIDVICQAWDRTVGYSDPKDHTSEILAPIAKDNDSNGVNIYKKDFDSLYPNARPN